MTFKWTHFFICIYWQVTNKYCLAVFTCITLAFYSLRLFLFFIKISLFCLLLLSVLNSIIFFFSLWVHEVKICKIKWQKNIYRLFHILSNLIFASQEIHVPHGSKMNKNERNLVRCIKMVWAPPCCDVLFIEMNKKLKREFINSFPTKLSPYSIAQWFRGYSTNLKVMSTEESTLLIMFFSPC